MRYAKLLNIRGYLRIAAPIIGAGLFIVYMAVKGKGIISLLSIPVIAVVLTCAYTRDYGFTAIASIIAGFLMMVITKKTGYMGMLTLTAMTSSLFWPLGRMMTGAAFMFCALFVGAVYEPDLLYEYIPPLFGGTLTFMLLPAELIEYLRTEKSEDRREALAAEEERLTKKADKLRNTALEQSRKWKDLAEAFSDIDILRDIFLQGARAFGGYNRASIQGTFTLSMGVSRCVGSSAYVSGDNYSFENLENGRSILMLSDGMGSGVSAYHDSDKAISRMEQLLEAGFSAKTSLWLLHQWLLSLNREDVGTTADILTANLETGQCELIKAGAAASYLLRQTDTDSDAGWEAELISAESMPLGIFDELHTGEKSFILRPGDVFVMMTDGVLDGLNGEKKEERMKGFLEFEVRKLKDTSPERLAQALSGAIVDFSTTDSEDKKKRDDMTAIVLAAQRA